MCTFDAKTIAYFGFCNSFGKFNVVCWGVYYLTYIELNCVIYEFSALLFWWFKSKLWKGLLHAFNFAVNDKGLLGDVDKDSGHSAYETIEFCLRFGFS